jgi:hypothetical protein
VSVQSGSHAWSILLTSNHDGKGLVGKDGKVRDGATLQLIVQDHAEEAAVDRQPAVGAVVVDTKPNFLYLFMNSVWPPMRASNALPDSRGRTDGYGVVVAFWPIT